MSWVARREGREEVAAFFQMLDSALEFHAFEPVRFLEGDGNVAALIRVDVTVRSTGRRIQDEEIHLLTFDGAGKVAALRHYLDTAKHIRALEA